MLHEISVVITSARNSYLSPPGMKLSSPPMQSIVIEISVSMGFTPSDVGQAVPDIDCGVYLEAFLLQQTSTISEIESLNDEH